MRSFRAAIGVVLVVAAGGLVACAPAPPSNPTLGCFRTPDTPIANAHVRISGSKVANKWTYWESIHYTANCSDPAVTPLEIFPGNPGATSLQFCQNKYGPTATPSPLLSKQLIPPQTYWGCNNY